MTGPWMPDPRSRRAVPDQSTVVAGSDADRTVMAGPDAVRTVPTSDADRTTVMRRVDYDGTVLMPMVPVDGPGAAETTMLMPTLSPRRDRPTVPVDSPTMVMSTVPVLGRDGRPVSRPAAAPQSVESPSIAKNSAIMAAGSLVSRVTGLIRTIMVGAAIGSAAAGNAYNLSNTVPNMVYELLLGGVLGSVLVPFLMRARLRETDGGDGYAQRLLTMATVFLGGATVLAVLAAPLLTRLFTVTIKHPDPSYLHLVTTLSYLILPEIFFYGIAALLAAILNTRGHFAAPTWTPILNNIVVIATSVVFIALPYVGKNLTKPLTPDNITSLQILVIGVGTTLGIVVQALGLFPSLRKVGFRWKWRFDWGRLHLRELGKASGWMLMYVIVSQLALVILLILLSGASSKTHRLADGSLPPGTTVYNSAFLIFMMAHGIVAVSIMTALMPRLSAAAAEGRFTDLAAQLSMGTRLSGVILIPATAAYVTLGQPLAVTLFQFNEYSHVDAMRTGTVISVMAIGLVPFAISQMQLFAFYAMPDTRTPALMNIPVAIVRILADVVFYVALPWVLVAAGLMVANTISYVVAVVVGYTLLRRRIGDLKLGTTMRALGRLIVAAVLAAIPTYAFVLVMQHELGSDKIVSLVTLLAGGVILILGYIASAIALKATDVTDVFAMVKGRFSR